LPSGEERAGFVAEPDHRNPSPEADGVVRRFRSRRLQQAASCCRWRGRQRPLTEPAAAGHARTEPHDSSHVLVERRPAALVPAPILPGTFDDPLLVARVTAAPSALTGAGEPDFLPIRRPGETLHAS
jgi:hypothetical protein